MSGSPKINLVEQDLSTYVETSGKNFAALIGFGTKGAINTPTLCVSKQDFINKFGVAPKNFPYSHLAAYHYFDYGSALLYTRIAVDPNADISEVPYESKYAKSSSISTYAIGTSATVVGTTEFAPTSGETIAFKINVDSAQFDNNIVVVCPTGTGLYDAADIVILINQELQAQNVLATASLDTGNRLRFTTASYGPDASITLNRINTSFPLTTVLGMSNAAIVTDIGEQGASNNSPFVVSFKEVGTAGNAYSLEFVRTYDNVNSEFVYSANVVKDGVSEAPVEKYDGVKFESSSASYFVKLINASSSYLTIDFAGTEPAASYIASANFSIALTGGDDGIPEVTDTDPATSASEIASITAKLYVNAIDLLANPEIYDFDILATPGNYSEIVINKAIAVAEARKDFLYLVDPPNGLDYEQVAKWHNGTGGYGLSASLNTSYASLYWAWQKDYDADNGELVTVPPSVFMLGKFAYIDKNYFPWNSPAGLERGKLTGSLDYEFSPNESQRDLIYGGLNAVNPIVNFLSEGLIIWGQKTLLRELKSTNRVNIRRLLIYIKKLVRKSMRGFIFEANIPDTWARASSSIRNILEPVKQSKGVSSYSVIIDATTNSASTIDQSQMNGVISITPVKEIEEINITFKVLSTGAVTFGA